MPICSAPIWIDDLRAVAASLRSEHLGGRSLDEHPIESSAMEILYAVHGYKPAYRIGGPIISVSAKAEHLVRHKGHEVTVFTTNCNLDQDLGRAAEPAGRRQRSRSLVLRTQGDPQALAPVRLVRLEIDRLPLRRRWRGSLSGLCRRWTWSTRISPLSIRRMPRHGRLRKFGKPLFYHQRGVFDPERLKFRSLKKQWYIRLIERPIMQQAAGLIALTEAEFDSYRTSGIETACHVVPNGIDVEQYRQTPSAEFERRWNLPADVPVILFMGRLHPTKGADKLLEASCVLGRISQQPAGDGRPGRMGSRAAVSERSRSAG